MKNKIVAFASVFMILVLCFSTAFANNSTSVNLTDPTDNKTYEINYTNKELTILNNGETLGNTNIHNADAFSLFDDILYIYYSDQLNHQTFVYEYDFLNDRIESFAINEVSFINERCFASDGEKVYFVWNEDTKKLCVYENGSVNTVNLKSQITEITLTNKGTLILCTNKGRFIYHNGEIETDSPIPSTIETTILPTQSPAVTIPYEIQNGFYIAKEGTTVSKIKKTFANLEIIGFTKADSTEIKSGKLGTNASFTLSTGEVVTIIIYGDLTGEGNINSRDLKAVLNHLSRKELLKGSFLISADIDLDGEITTKDALKLSQMY